MLIGSLQIYALVVFCCKHAGEIKYALVPRVAVNMNLASQNSLYVFCKLRCQVSRTETRHYLYVVYLCVREYLKYNGQLLWGVSVLHAHRQPNLKRSQLLRKEWAVL